MTRLKIAACMAAATISLAGCYSVEVASSPVLGEEVKQHVIVDCYGWYLFGSVPLICGNKNVDSWCPISLFRDDVARVNGFDENYVGWGYEDDDFARRLYKTGVRPASVILAARAMHLWHPSLAPQELKHHRDRPNRAYFRRWFVPAFCKNGLVKPS